MTPDERRTRGSPHLRARAEEHREFLDYDRLAEERRGMTVDASVIRFDEPDREPWRA